MYPEAFKFPSIVLIGKFDPGLFQRSWFIRNKIVEGDEQKQAAAEDFLSKDIKKLLDDNFIAAMKSAPEIQKNLLSLLQ